MRPIVRSAEPPPFAEWKAKGSSDWQPTWGNFQGPEKPQVLETLMRDQGFVCCYCERRVSVRNVHIEHLQSRHAAPHLALEFANFLACCQRELPKEIKAPVHCGHLKGDKPLDVHPLMRDSRAFFIFDSEGGIRPSDDPARSGAAQRAIETLGLGISKLSAMRRGAIDGAIALLEEGASAEELIELMDSKDAGGHYTPFASAVVQFLVTYSSPAQAM